METAATNYDFYIYASYAVVIVLTGGLVISSVRDLVLLRRRARNLEGRDAA
jgi:heme exporter protein D